jgi:pyruvyltransferase
VKVYWWNDKPNFGDTLTHTLLNHLGVAHERSRPEDADLIMTGSILEHMPSGWAGTVLGAGKLRQRSDIRIPLRHAKFLGVRGPLTAKDIGGDLVLGDPGLLAPHIVHANPATIELGVIPHFMDIWLYDQYAWGKRIDPKRGAKAVLTDISLCKQVVTSSLHGAIVADALGIPRLAVPFDSEFKWYDYANSVGDSHPHFGIVHSPKASAIEARQKELYEAVLALLAP